MRRLILLCSLSAACNNPVFIGERRPLATTDPTAMQTMAGAMGVQPDTDVFVVPVRQPTDKEMQQLADAQTALGLMMPVPWAQLGDFDIEVEYSIKNLEDTDVTAKLSLDGGSEFGDYNPALYVDPNANPDEVTPPPHLMGGTPVTIPAQGTVLGIFREDQFTEAGKDLEAITRYPDPANVMDAPFKVLTRRSSADTTGYENVPANDIIPAMTRLAFTLTSDSHVAMDYTVRVRDHNNKLYHPVEANPPDGWVSIAAQLTPPYAPAF
jgi:hypothetical protein